MLMVDIDVCLYLYSSVLQTTHTHKPRAACISFGEITPLQSMHSNLVPRPAGNKVVISPEVVVKEDGVASQQGAKGKDLKKLLVSSQR